jgi:hypothetical protein
VSLGSYEISSFGYKLVSVLASMDTMNYLAGTVKSWLITYGSYVSGIV